MRSWEHALLQSGSSRSVGSSQSSYFSILWKSISTCAALDLCEAFVPVSRTGLPQYEYVLQGELSPDRRLFSSFVTYPQWTTPYGTLHFILSPPIPDSGNGKGLLMSFTALYREAFSLSTATCNCHILVFLSCYYNSTRPKEKFQPPQ